MSWYRKSDTPTRDPAAGADRIDRRGVMAALDASHPLIWFDARGWVVDANAKAADLLLYGFGTPGRLHYVDLTGMRRDRDDLGGPHWTRIASGRLVCEERSLYRSDNVEIWGNLNHAAILNADGSARRILTIAIDLSPWAWRPRTAAPVRL